MTAEMASPAGGQFLFAQTLQPCPGDTMRVGSSTNSGALTRIPSNATLLVPSRQHWASRAYL